MTEYIRYLKSDFLKLCHSWFFPLHIIIPVLGAVLMLLYATISGSGEFFKIAAFFQVVAVAFPFVISIVCQIVAEQEMRAGYFQNMLTLPYRGKAIWSKFTLMVLSGLFSCLLGTALFGAVFSLIESVKLPFGFFVFIPAVLWGSNVLLYALHLILTFQFGRSLGVSVGVLGSLLAALMQTGLGDGLWYVIPYGLGGHFVEIALEYVFLPTVAAGIRVHTGIAFLTAATCAIMLIMTVWFSRYSGTHAE